MFDVRKKCFSSLPLAPAGRKTGRHQPVVTLKSGTVLNAFRVREPGRDLVLMLCLMLCFAIDLDAVKRWPLPADENLFNRPLVHK
jgi:hypothetical protein